jgi:hypothetical protein
MASLKSLGYDNTVCIFIICRYQYLDFQNILSVTVTDACPCIGNMTQVKKDHILVACFRLHRPPPSPNTRIMTTTLALSVFFSVFQLHVFSTLPRK